MKIQRIGHVSIIVNNLPATKALFLDLGLELPGEGEVQGELVDQIVRFHDQPPDQREGARPQVEVTGVSYFCSSFTPMASAGPAAIHVKPRRLSRVLGPAR